MVSEQIVNDTVKKMLVSNIDEETIISTLADIGIDEAKAKEIIAGVKSGSTSTPVDEVVQQTIPSVDNTNEQKMQTMQNELAAQGEKTELHETVTHTMLNDHADKLDTMNQKVDEVKKVMSSPANLDASLKVRLNELEKKTAEINAQTTAMMEVMKKVLETNRSILTELKSK
jgi:hypothetical protein